MLATSLALPGADVSLEGPLAVLDAAVALGRDVLVAVGAADHLDPGVASHGLLGGSSIDKKNASKKLLKILPKVNSEKDTRIDY